MNLKQAKRLRKWYGSNRLSTSEQLIELKPTKAIRMTPKGFIPIPGLPVPTAIFLGKREMIPLCTRRRYKDGKKSFNQLSHLQKGAVKWNL